MALLEDIEFCQILDELMPYLPEAKDAIQILVEELKCGSVTNWGIIRDVFRQLKPHRFPEIAKEVFTANDSFKNFRTFIFRVLNLFDMHKNSDISVIADVLEILCLTTIHSYLEIGYANWIDIRFSKNNGLTSMSAFEKSLVFPYKGISSLVLRISDSVNIISSRNWIECLTSCGEVDVLKAIISYGATLLVPSKLTYDGNELVDFILHMLPEIHNGVEVPVRMLPSVIQRNMILKFDEKSFKRLYVIINVLMTFTFFDFYTITDDCIECARIFMKCTPEPFITSEEFKSVLTKLYSGVVSNDQLMKLLKVYESHFPESREASTPRSLKHLSRFQVRESLRTARSFPHGVTSLRVPKKIQDYICLKDILS